MTSSPDELPLHASTDEPPRSAPSEPFHPQKVRLISEATIRHPAKTSVFAYARFSTSSQRDSSIDRQLENIGAYAAHNGIHISRTFTDYARSGANIEREGLQELLAACRASPGAMVLVENSDRLFRSVEAYAQITIEFVKCDVTIHDTNGKMSKFQEIIYAAMAAEDRRRILDRTAAGRLREASDGKWITSYVPYGYKRVAKGHLVLHEVHAEVVRQIFEMRAGGMSYMRIAAELDRRSIPRPTGNGPWSRSTINKILSNPVYAGYCVWNLTVPADGAR